MKKSVLIIINTPFQMITAIQLASTEYKEYLVDVVITDNIAQYIELSERASRSGLFTNVYSMVTKDQSWQNWKYTLFGAVFNRAILKRLPFLKVKKYDVALFANSGGVSACIATLLRCSYGTTLGMYEDGFASYSDFYHDEIKDAYKPRHGSGKIIYCLRKRAPAYLKYYYVFEPELINEWDFPFIIKRIPKIENEAVSLLNMVFDYNKHIENYDYKYIFFEESYFADGIDIGDMKIVEEISHIVGKDNLLIKIHPRNPVNRFKDRGFHTNADTSLPWEVIALNINLENKTLITIASGSSITSYFVSGRAAKHSLLLYEMDILDRNKLTPSLVVFDKICKNSEYFVHPQNLEQLKQILLKQ